MVTSDRHAAIIETLVTPAANAPDGGPAEPGQAESGILFLPRADLGQRCALTFKTRRASLGTTGKSDFRAIGGKVHFSNNTVVKNY